MTHARKFLAGTRFLGLIFVLLGTALASQLSFAQTPQFINIGTGNVSGVYYPTGNALCRALNKQADETAVRCSAESSAGSVVNLKALQAKTYDLALAQSDSQLQAYNGSHEFQDVGPNRNLRTVLTLNTESFAVVASKASGIQTFDDLAGKRVNIGKLGSGQRLTMNAIMHAKGWTKESFAPAAEVSTDGNAHALCNGDIDAFVFASGHPSASLKQVSNECEVMIVALDRATLDALLAENTFYYKTRIPGNMYRGAKQSIETLGVSTSLLASADTSPELIYTLVENIVAELKTVQKTHPALDSISSITMAKSSDGIPMHQGALKYFNEID